MRRFLSFLLLLGSAALVSAQDVVDEAPALPSDESLWDLPFDTLVPFFIAFSIIGLLILLLLYLTAQMAFYYRSEWSDRGERLPWVLRLFGLFEGDTKVLTGEYVDVPMDDHEYDGIRELDNKLPPWWVYGFYLTIVVGVIYFFSYQVFDWGPSQEEEYLAEVEEASVLYANVDRSYEMPETDAAKLATAKELYNLNCVACHREDGGGQVGPNLTDEYWLHGGDVNALYHTIKYGVPDKGMKAWKADFSNEEIYQLASYVLALVGSDPENPKDPQGEKYVPEEN